MKEFAPSKGTRIKELMRDLTGETGTAENVNILGTNRWTVELDYSGVHPNVRLKKQLNTVTKGFVIDHFDEEAADSFFDIDSLNWCSRADGEGIWGIYDAILRRRSVHAEKPKRTSLIELIKGWFSK